MHNLHLARIKAKSHDEACRAVLSYIEDWGLEDNWRSIGGAICEDGTGEPYDDYARWGVDTDVQEQINRLNEACLDAVLGKQYLTGHLHEKLTDILNMTIEDMMKEKEWFYFYTAKQFFDFLLKTAEARKECKESYDIFTSVEFFAYSYGDFGLTDIGNIGYNEDELKECKTYVVLIDMHT